MNGGDGYIINNASFGFFYKCSKFDLCEWLEFFFLEGLRLFHIGAYTEHIDKGFNTLFNKSCTASPSPTSPTYL